MTRERRLLGLFIAGLLLTSAATAQDATQDQEMKWYTVEAVIFARVAPAHADTEHWMTDPGEPELEGAIELVDAAEQPLDAELREALDGVPYAFSRLPAVERQLDAVVERLERSDTYRPLIHLAWRQPGFSQEEAKPIHVQVGPKLLYPPPLDEDGEPSLPLPLPSAFADEAAPGDAAPGAPPPDRPLSTALEGTLRLHLGRYLHLKADLLYFTPPPEDAVVLEEEEERTPPDPNENAMGEPDVTEIWHPTLFRLEESRRMRSGELHYFDHPLFGVLALVTPFELPQEAEVQEGEGEPAGAAAN